MQNVVKDYVRVIAKDVKGKTLDVGSLDVNGSLRNLFEDYTGLDMREGKNVDIVANAHAIPFEDNTFDCVVCTDTLEHDDNPFQSMKEIHRVVKSGGLVIVTVPNICFKKHDYPHDYFRYTIEGLKVLLKDFEKVKTMQTYKEVLGHGYKKL